ncbi:MAG: DUF5615 family PIN-like protein [Draconibacterium sp.]|nr:DUF5615 family PIN-like protein [Draconibacterium sp.]
MKFLCDVHISYKVTKHLQSLGFEAVHINDILDKSCSSDKSICHYADKNDLIVITKDPDFRNSFYINNSPKKFIKINLGNISNDLLIQVITDNLEHFKKLNNSQVFIVEVDKTSIQFNVWKNK